MTISQISSGHSRASPGDGEINWPESDSQCSDTTAAGYIIYRTGHVQPRLGFLDALREVRARGKDRMVLEEGPKTGAVHLIDILHRMKPPHESSADLVARIVSLGKEYFMDRAVMPFLIHATYESAFPLAAAAQYAQTHGPVGYFMAGLIDESAALMKDAMNRSMHIYGDERTASRLADLMSRLDSADLDSRVFRYDGIDYRLRFANDSKANVLAAKESISRLEAYTPRKVMLDAAEKGRPWYFLDRAAYSIGQRAKRAVWRSIDSVMWNVAGIHTVEEKYLLENPYSPNKAAQQAQGE